MQVTSSGKSNFSCTSKYSVLADLGGGAGTSLSAQFSYFKQFFAEIWPNRLVPPPFGVCVLHCLGKSRIFTLLRINGYSILS